MDERRMGYILYGHRRSGSPTVEMALAEIGAKFEVRDVDLDSEAQRNSSYTTVKYQKKLPRSSLLQVKH